MDIADFLKRFEVSPEEEEKRRNEHFENTKKNPENMSYWLPKIIENNENISSLKIPETKVIQLSYKWWNWLCSDNYTDEKIKEFNDHLKERISDFQLEQPLFMKTGVFSNKFEFNNTLIDNENNIGEKFLDMFYTSMLLGADNTSEAVFRQQIRSKEERLMIYNGMPLHTEFRVFYDFDNEKAVGVSNYWHPDVMAGNLNPEDEANYLSEKDKIVNDFNNYKQKVINEVEKFLTGNKKLTGKWSVDVMKNADEFWLIDMARMERSALVPQMEEI